MILTRDGKEITAIYRQDGSEVEEAKDAAGRLIYTASREITGTLPLPFSGRGKPLTDYLISGNALQDGTPTPEAPVDATGCGVRTGNLFDKSATNTNNGYIPAGYLISDGSVKSSDNYRASEYIAVSPNQSYTLWYGTYLNAPSVCFYDNSKNFISGVAYSGKWTVTFTTPQNSAFLRFSFRLIDSDKAKLNHGPTALPYEPYGYKLPLTVNGTEYPIYLGEVQTTRRIKKLVLTGEENWQIRTDGTYIFYLVLSAMKVYAPCKASHYKHIVRSVPSTMLDGEITTVLGSGVAIWIKSDDYTTTDDFKSYLAAQYANGNPVTIWYVLAKPETAIVNEPLMKIDSYADTITMEQAGMTIPTVSGANILDMTSPVKPSEVYIKGKGIKPTGYGQLENNS